MSDPLGFVEINTGLYVVQHGAEKIGTVQRTEAGRWKAIEPDGTEIAERATREEAGHALRARRMA